MVNDIEELESQNDIPYYEQCIKYINKKLDEGLTEEEIIKKILKVERRFKNSLMRTGSAIEGFAILEELKSEFMTARGFRKSLERDKLTGTQFD